jgi:translation initiation factor IF-2
VVAADDGVMQQTVEAINHAKAAQVPIIVAVNKVDKPNANIERVKRELADQGLVSSEWGGDVTMVEVSAKKRMGIEELLEMVLLQAEMMELKANPNKPARGHVIEAKLDKGRGPVATILIQEGTLKSGDAYVCGVHSGRVRTMYNDRGQRMEQAPPSVPVEVVGFSGVPNAGDDFIVLSDDKQAKVVAEHRLARQREKELSRSTKVTLEKLYEQIREGAIKELNVIVRTDVQGSLEAISDSLVKLSTTDVKVNVLHSATGAITETDIMLASASNAIVIGFNVRGDAKVQELADQEKVDVRYYDVIYQILNDIRDAMVGMLEPEYQENVLGRAEVRQTFGVPKVGTIAGCYVLDGHIERGARVRVLRDQVVLYDGKINSLKRFKDDVKEAKAGFECGIGIENFNDIKVNDILEAYQLQEVKPTTLSGETLSA